MWVDPWLVLASLNRTSRLAAMREGFEGRTGNPTALLGVLLAATALCGLLVLVMELRQRSRQRSRSRTKYLGQAIRVLGLNRMQSRDVRWIARRSRSAHPAAMLLSPANLAQALDEALRGGSNPRLRGRVQQICRQVFGADLPVPRGHFERDDSLE